MPNLALKSTALLDEIKSLLGGSSVNVELTEPDIKVAIRKALRVYNHWRPGQGGPIALPVSSNQKKYPIAHVGLAGVTRCDFVDARYGNTPTDVFDPNNRNTGGLGDGFTAGQLAQQSSYREDARRITGSEPDWKYVAGDTGSGTLYVDIPPGVPYKATYYYTFYFDEKWDAANGIQFVPQGDTDWFTEYVTAVAKQIVGEARRKFGGIAESGGSSTEVAGQSLIDEGKEAITDLTDKIKKRRRPMAPEVD